MKLTAPTAGARPRRGSSNQRTTTPGYVNDNKQKVLESTGAKSDTRPDQVIYRMQCGRCSAEYGSHGCEIHARCCPKCGNGAKGEPLPAKSITLFG